MKVIKYYQMDRRYKDYFKPVYGKASPVIVMLWRIAKYIQHISLKLTLYLEDRIRTLNDR